MVQAIVEFAFVFLFALLFTMVFIVLRRRR
jgi:hypothetical protein